MPNLAAGADRGDRLEFSKELRMVGPGAQVLARQPVFMTDFTRASTTALAGLTNTETGAATPFAPSTSVVGGAAVATTGATTNNAEETGGTSIIWQPSTQATTSNLRFECRAKFVGATTPTDGDFYLGLADAKTYASGLSYVLSAASAFTTSAPSDFVGFGYTSIATSGNAFQSGGNPIVGISTIANTDTVTVLSQNGGSVVKDSAFHIYRVEVDSAGNASFYIDDVFKGFVAAACTAATLYTPYIDVIAKNSHTQTATVSYVYVGGALV